MIMLAWFEYDAFRESLEGFFFQFRTSQAVSARMIALIASSLKPHRIVICCAVENQRSRAIPEPLGFSVEGVARQAKWLHDHLVDLGVYVLRGPRRLGEPKRSHRRRRKSNEL